MILENIPVLHADICLPTGRLYSLKSLQDTLERYKDIDIPGQIGMPNVSQEERDSWLLKNDFNNIAFSSKLKSIVDNQLIADITILNTSKGNWFKVQLANGNIVNPIFRTAAIVKTGRCRLDLSKAEVEIVELLQINYISNPV